VTTAATARASSAARGGSVSAVLLAYYDLAAFLLSDRWRVTKTTPLPPSVLTRVRRGGLLCTNYFDLKKVVGW